MILTMVERTLNVLLVRCGQEPFEGMWAIPGGFTEDGWVIPTGRRTHSGPEGGRPAELLRAGRAWNHGGPIHLLQRQRERKP